MSQADEVFVVTVRVGSSNGDASYPVLVTRDFVEALGVLKRLDELGFRRKFCQRSHGVIIHCMDLDRLYDRGEYTYITGLPVPQTFPAMVLFGWNPETDDFRVEWFPTPFRRAGVTLPPELLEGAISLEG